MSYLIAYIVVIFLILNGVFSRVLYVNGASPAATDTPMCGPVDTPCATLAFALSVVEQGDEVVLAPGSYACPGSMPARDFMLRSASPLAAQFNLTVGHPCFIFEHGQTRTMQLENLSFELLTDAAITALGTSGPVVRACRFRSGMVYAHNSTLRLEDCLFEGCSPAKGGEVNSPFPAFFPPGPLWAPALPTSLLFLCDLHTSSGHHAHPLPSSPPPLALCLSLFTLRPAPS